MKRVLSVVLFLLSIIAAPVGAQQVVVPEAPGPDVPAECAKFFGNWVGNWPYIGRQWLRVVKVGTSCMVNYSYMGSDTAPKPSQVHTASIEKGELSMKCGGSGTCTFTVHGDDLWARYSGPQGSNNAVFGRM